MRMHNRLLTLGAIASLLALTGCFWGRGDDRGHGGEGDRHEERGRDGGDHHDDRDHHDDGDRHDDGDHH